MNAASQTGSMDEDRIFAPELLFSPISGLIFPSFRTRFAVALFLSFFPLAILYPLAYPVRELVTLCSWLWVFPSPVSCLALSLTPLLLSGTYGYFAFNLFCSIAVIGIAITAARSQKQMMEDMCGPLYRTARLCAFITIAVCILQAVSGPDLWKALFPNMLLGDEAGRGAGLVSEPSVLAGPLVLYLVLLTIHIQSLRSQTAKSKEQRNVLCEGLIVVLCFVFLSRSISVTIAAATFLPILLFHRRNPIFATFSAGTALFAGSVALGGRIREALIDAQGELLAFLTVALNSWRNIPDILILANYPAFLLPTDPAALRTKITAYAVELDPALAWIENTYSLFAASASTMGLIAVALVFVSGLVVGLRWTSKSAALRLSWMSLYLYDWFLSPKFDAAGWIALGALPLAWRMAGEKPAVELSD